MSLHNGIDTCAFVSLGLFTKTFGASTYTIIDGHPVVTQAGVNSLFVSLGLVESAVYTGGWHRWINIMGWPWRKLWKLWG